MPSSGREATSSGRNAAAGSSFAPCGSDVEAANRSRWQHVFAPYKQEVARSSRAPPIFRSPLLSGTSAGALADDMRRTPGARTSRPTPPVAPKTVRFISRPLSCCRRCRGRRRVRRGALPRNPESFGSRHSRGRTTGMETTEATPARPPVVSQIEWDAGLTALLERERNVAAAMHELAAARKRMPMVRVERDYAFEGPDGRRSLPELFDGRSQLILYRFFFEEGVDGWPDAGCVGCSSFADGIPELGLLHSRDITFAMASPAPQANLQRYAERMGWTDVPWYTICTERFSADFGVDEWFGLNIFLRDGKDVYRTYFLQHGAMVQFIGSIWTVMSLTPYGGQSVDEDVPEGWPQAPQSFWFRRHDEFDEPPPSARLGIDADDRP